MTNTNPPAGEQPVEGRESPPSSGESAGEELRRIVREELEKMERQRMGAGEAPMANQEGEPEGANIGIRDRTSGRGESSRTGDLRSTVREILTSEDQSKRKSSED